MNQQSISKTEEYHIAFDLQMLTLPQDMVRSFRDDITLVVPFFDSEFLGKN